MTKDEFVAAGFPESEWLNMRDAARINPYTGWEGGAFIALIIALFSERDHGRNAIPRDDVETFFHDMRNDGPHHEAAFECSLDCGARAEWVKQSGRMLRLTDAGAGVVEECKDNMKAMRG